MSRHPELAWQDRNFEQQLTQSQELLDKNDDVILTQRFAGQDMSAISDGVLSKAIVTIKDLFDVQGYVTRAGSVFLKDNTPAKEDAESVRLLREAGAYLLGHTNMTELAYSGLGMNPHYGTPQSPLYPGCIAGGSTSGGAVSVALGIADIALGSDTGGSLRIPAAFCGLTGFKPSQQSVSTEGALPLSTTLDSIGPIAKSVADCEAAWQVLSGTEKTAAAAQQAHFVVPTNFGLDNLDTAVEEGFRAALAILRQIPGVVVEERPVSLLEAYKALPVWQFSAFEAREFYQQTFALDLAQLDPRVASRLRRADSLDEQTFAQTCQQRQTLIERYQQEESGVQLLLPTVAILPPKLSDLTKDEDYDRINLLCLRNTTLANVLDACSVSLPFEHQEHHIGVMLTGANGSDEALLAAAKLVEKALA
ncbi:amidase family protein [Marinomonas sp.]